MTFPNKVSTPDPWIQGSLKSVCNLLPVLAQTTPFHILFVAAKMYYFYYSPPLILTLPSLVFCAFAHAIHHVYSRHFFFPLPTPIYLSAEVPRFLQRQIRGCLLHRTLPNTLYTQLNVIISLHKFLTACCWNLSFVFHTYLFKCHFWTIQLWMPCNCVT